MATPRRLDRDRLIAIAKTFERQGRSDKAAQIYATLEGRAPQREGIADRIQALVSRNLEQRKPKTRSSEPLVELAPSGSGTQAIREEIDLAGTFDDEPPTNPAAPQEQQNEPLDSHVVADHHEDEEDEMVKVAASMMGWKPRQTTGSSRRSLAEGPRAASPAVNSAKKSAQSGREAGESPESRPQSDDGKQPFFPFRISRRDKEDKEPVQTDSAAANPAPRSVAGGMPKGAVTTWRRPDDSIATPAERQPVAKYRPRQFSGKPSTRSPGSRTTSPQNPFTEAVGDGSELAADQRPEPEKPQPAPESTGNPLTGPDEVPPKLVLVPPDPQPASGAVGQPGKSEESPEVVKSDDHTEQHKPILILPAAKIRRQLSESGTSVAVREQASLPEANPFAATTKSRQMPEPASETPAVPRNEPQPSPEQLPHKPAELALVSTQRPLPSVVDNGRAGDGHRILIVPAGTDASHQAAIVREAQRDREKMRSTAAQNEAPAELSTQAPSTDPADFIADEQMREIHTPQVLLLLGALNDPNSRQRALGVFKLGQAGSEARTVLPLLRRMLKTEQDPIVRVRIAEAIARIAPQDEQAITFLAESLTHQAHWKVRELAACALEVAAPKPNEQVVSRLITAMDDFHPGVRTMAALTLASFGPEADVALPRLETATKTDVGKVKEAAAAAIPLIHAHESWDNSNATEEATP